ncbi:MAG: hypothetical protein RMJ37_05795 [Spirochaetia bacterium]|nr:hypothetical protein [Spirochaetota bacterium]MCX8097323.1 hypothetical protein [Spirochaetota bacterium]MDW8112828.1 hypothetical protein [Spirochaetia bacterium]
MKRRLVIDIHTSNIHYRLKRLGELMDVINEKILEIGMSFLREAGVRGIDVDGTGVGGIGIREVNRH